jgi:hypothetical protein
VRSQLRLLGLLALHLGCGRSGIAAFSESDADGEGDNGARGGSSSGGNGAATGGSQIGGAPTGGSAMGGGSLGGAGGGSSLGGSGGIAGASGMAGSPTVCVPAAAEPEMPFAFGFGDQAPQNALAIIPTNGGGAFLVGEFIGRVEIGGASATADEGGGAFVTLLAANGQPVWTRFLSSDFSILAPAVALAPNGTLWVGGGFSGTASLGGAPLPADADRAAFLANFDECGNILSQRRWGEVGSRAAIESIAVASNGDVVVAGGFMGAIDLGGGRIAATSSTEWDGFIARYHGAGGYVFGHGLGNKVRGLHVAIHHSGSTLVGELRGDLVIDGTLIASAAGMSAFAVKLDASGKPLWAFRDVRAKTDRGTSSLSSVVIDGRGNALIRGSFQYDGVDFGSGSAMEWQCCGGNVFALLVAPDGSPLWLVPIGAYMHAELSPHADGYVIVTNYFSAHGIRVHRLDENGVEVDTQSLGFASYVGVQSVSVAGDGSLLLAGRYRGRLDLGAGSIETTEGLDWHGFVARLPDTSE